MGETGHACNGLNDAQNPKGRKEHLGFMGSSLRLRHNVRDLWESILRVLVLVVHAIVRCIDGAACVERFLCFLGIHAFCTSHTRWKLPLLPCRVDPDDNKLTVVLDLDETLVCAYHAAGLPAGLHKQAVSSGMHWFHLECKAKDLKVSHVAVYERPGLREFLLRASKFAELIVFTAGQEGYARPVLDMIDPDNRISARLYRPSTVTVARSGEHVKDLSRLGRHLRRTVIIDNNPCSFILQPLNGIPCVPFTAENASDNELLEVLLPLLELLSSAEDVRPVLKERFQMNSWFRSHGF